MIKYSFSRNLRLTTGYQFRFVFRNSHKISMDLCAVYCCRNNQKNPRVGVVVTKKNIRKASDRNCFKRTIREFFRLNQHRFGCVDVVFFAYKNIKHISKERLYKCLGQILEKLVFFAKQKKL